MTTKYLNCKLSNKSQCDDTKDFFQELSRNEHKYDQIDGYTYQTNLIILEDVVYNIARKLWRQAEDVLDESNCNYDMEKIQKQLTSLFSYINKSVHDYTNIAIELKPKLSKFLEIFKKSILKWSDLDNHSLSLLTSHSVLIEDAPISRYFHTYINVQYSIVSIESVLNTNEIESSLQNVMDDLIAIAYKIFEKHHNENMLTVNVYICRCVEKLWRKLYNLADSEFWPIFNNLVNDKDEEFTMWLLLNLAELCSKHDNGVLVERILSSTTKNDGKLARILKLLAPLLTDVWIETTKLEPYLLLWEYFYKNLNQKVKFPKTYKDVVEVIDVVQTTPYECFLSMLRRHFTVHPKQWGKFRGRIYSRLPPHKINEYNDEAVYRISLLFLTLAPIEIDELEKLRSLLDGLPDVRRNTEIMWIIYITMMFVSLRQSHEIQKLAFTMTGLLFKASEHREQYYLVKHFIDAFGTLMDANADFALGQHLLIAPWIGKYIVACSHNDLCAILNTFIWIVEQMNENADFIAAFVVHVLPTLKQLSRGTAPPQQIGTLAAMLSQRLPEPLIQTYCGIATNVKVTNQFLKTLLQGDPIVSLNDETVLIQAWVKCSLLGVGCTDVTKQIFKFQTIGAVNVTETNEPIHALIDVLRSKNNRLLCEICFGNLDKWLGAYLTPSAPEAQICKIYTDLSLLFYNCAPLLYHKSKAMCLLTRLVNVLILPMDVLMGKPPNANVLKSMIRTWHLYLKGIFKLDYVSDVYIERTLKDLIVRYLPHFPATNSPVFKVMDVVDLASFVLDKISQTFLLRVARSSEENTSKAIRTIRDVLESTNDLNTIKLIVQKILVGTFEVCMFNAQRNLAVDLLKFISSSRWYEQVREDFRRSINAASEKHLAFSANNFFQFCAILIKLVPIDVHACLPHIKLQVCNVERMRGVGFDNTLRQGLDRIENSLSL